MKTLQLIAGMMLMSTMLQAQWQLSGNTSTNPAIDFLGTTDNQDLSFRTNNTIRMQLESTGELGIGTTSPSSWLHVLSRTGGTVTADEVFRTAVPTGTETY
jgi:hypothetical protein